MSVAPPLPDGRGRMNATYCPLSEMLGFEAGPAMVSVVCANRS